MLLTNKVIVMLWSLSLSLPGLVTKIWKVDRPYISDQQSPYTNHTFAQVFAVLAISLVLMLLVFELVPYPSVLARRSLFYVAYII